MRRHFRFVGGLVILAAAAVLVGCSDGQGLNTGSSRRRAPARRQAGPGGGVAGAGGGTGARDGGGGAPAGRRRRRDRRRRPVAGSAAAAARARAVAAARAAVRRRGGAAVRERRVRAAGGAGQAAGSQRLGGRRRDDGEGRQAPAAASRRRRSWAAPSSTATSCRPACRCSTRRGALARADCVHTMTTGTGSKTISGDVVLPSQPQRGGQVVLIDRGNTALTFVNPATCAVDRQHSVKGGLQLREPARRRHRERQQGVRHPLRQERARPRTRWRPATTC